MADTKTTPAVAATKPSKKKVTASKKKPSNPSMSDLTLKAMGATKEWQGMSLPALKKALKAVGYDMERNNARLLLSLRSLVSKGKLLQHKGSYKINKKEAPKKKKQVKKKSVAKAKTPGTAKKPRNQPKDTIICYYMGKTNRCLTERIKEHLYNVNRQDMKNALAKNVVKEGSGHSFKFMVIEKLLVTDRGADVKVQTERLETNWILRLAAHKEKVLNDFVPLNPVLKLRSLKH
ncbi:histone H1C-like [Protopterus annectens]|uniref:histone H1C-like n=1 Tax=Protopterus annectens TaxID=7888 RepID=UPI001CFA5388|nr:histone H1C-like [Protopterus annectens]